MTGRDKKQTDTGTNWVSDGNSQGKVRGTGFPIREWRSPHYLSLQELLDKTREILYS